MEEDDNEFFILVLGVLVAIIMIVSWWYTSVSWWNSSSADAIAADRTFPTQVDSESVTADEADAEVDDDGSTNGDSADDTETDSSERGSASGSSNDDPDAAENEPATDPGTSTTPEASTVFDAIAADPELSVIAELLRAEGLDKVLVGSGPFTVFAPSNDALSEAAASETVVAVLEAARSSVLTYHVVPGTYTAEDLADIARGSRSMDLSTVQGEPITLTIDSENVVINGTAVIAATSQGSGNGLVHKLDNVLVPPVAALNALVEFEPILFDSGSTDIAEDSFATLDRFTEILAGNNVNVGIQGHTDSSGDPLLNQDLSQGRARAVLNYLVARGIEESRLSFMGFGSTEPVADNSTPEGRALNRRIEFTLE